MAVGTIDAKNPRTGGYLFGEILSSNSVSAVSGKDFAISAILKRADVWVFGTDVSSGLVVSMTFILSSQWMESPLTISKSLWLSL